MYICIANNEAGNVTLTINVSWPILGKSDVISTTASLIESTRLYNQNNSPRTRFVIPPTTSSSASNNLRDGADHVSLTNLTRSGSNVGLSSGLPGSADDRQNYTVLSDVDVDRLRRPRLFSATEFVCAIVGTHLATLVLCFLVIPIVCRTRWRRRLQEKERQQLHHRLHYNPPLLHPTYEQQQPVQSAAGTTSRNRPPLQLPDNRPERSEESAYLNAIGQNRHNHHHPPPLYLTDYLLTPPLKWKYGSHFRLYS